MTLPKHLVFLALLAVRAPDARAQPVEADVLVVGGGTGGIGAALQSARLGARTIVAESTPWLGGMLSAAGVSATDGNHRLPSGLWREFRERLYAHHGGPEGRGAVLEADSVSGENARVSASTDIVQDLTW